MSYPYDSDIAFRSEQDAVDSHIFFEVSNDYFIDEYYRIIFNSSKEAYSQIFICEYAVVSHDFPLCIGCGVDQNLQKN